MATHSKIRTTKIAPGEYLFAYVSIWMYSTTLGTAESYELTPLQLEEDHYAYLTVLEFDGTDDYAPPPAPRHVEILFSKDFTQVTISDEYEGTVLYSGPVNNDDPSITGGMKCMLTVLVFEQPSGVDPEAVNALIDARFNNNNGTLTPNDDHLKFDDKVTSPVTSATLDDCGYYNVTYASGTGVGFTT